MVCAGRACVCAHGRVNGVVRGKPQSHAASESEGSLRAASLKHGSSRGPLWVALEGVQAPRCGWEPGSHIHFHPEVKQGTSKALSIPAGSVASFLLQWLWLPVLGVSSQALVKAGRRKSCEGPCQGLPALFGALTLGPCLSCTTAVPVPSLVPPDPNLMSLLSGLTLDLAHH